MRGNAERYDVDRNGPDHIVFTSMKRSNFVVSALCVVVASLAASFPAAGQAPAVGKLILTGDLAVFAGGGKPENCFLRNRFKRGENVGFRLSAIDGGTGAIEASAEIVVQVTQGGKTVEVPARYRGVVPPGGRGNPIPYLWTAKWSVPADAATGVVRFKAVAKDNKGRTAEWSVFANEEAAQLTVVE
jgi:hypothetical protein